MNVQLSRGCLVAFEGIDGSGKSTQIGRVAEALTAEGFEVVTTFEPTRGQYGSALRASMATGRLEPERELELFLLDREEHVQTFILPALEAGRVVLTDRYYFSTLAYQGARGFDLDTLREQNEAIAPPPDLLLLFDLDVDVALERIQSGRGDRPNAFEERAMLEACLAIFRELGDLPYAHLLDATASPDAITRRALALLADGPLHGLLEIG